MSLIITVHAREGIVMAADSRLTLTIPRTLPNGNQHTISVTSSDSAKKLFLAPNRIGISTFGAASIGGVPLAGFIESFIVEHLKGKTLTPEQVAGELLAFFSGLGVSQETNFHVSGYTSQPSGLEQTILYVNLSTQNITRLNSSSLPGANWGGEADVLQRLLNDVALITPGAAPTPIPQHLVPFEFFTLQDAIDFAAFAIRSTIETLRFQSREKTVGGPIDVLVITPDDARWIAQKQLEVR